jgi:transposase-like protein
LEDDIITSLKIGGKMPKNSFDPEFRSEAAKLVVEQKYPIREVARA